MISGRLNELSRLEWDWDGNGGNPTTPTARKIATEVLMDWLINPVSPKHIEESLEIFPIHNGGLFFTLENGPDEVQLRIRADGPIDVLVVHTVDGRRIYQEHHDISRDEAVRYLDNVPADV